MKTLLDPILGADARKKAGAVLAVANVLLVVLQVAADQLQTLPSWPWVATASGVLAAGTFYLTKFTTIGNKVFTDVGD